MTYITTTATIIITLSTLHQLSFSNIHMYMERETRRIHLKQGVLIGKVMVPRINDRLGFVEQYLGIPYAAPPVGGLRFMPSGTALPWINNTKYAFEYGPVCPQKFPDTRKMAPERKEQFLRLRKYLENQNEDCLYLNIYAPYQENVSSSRRYPVMVYIHGESFEWNSGNPYDGSVLASYGKVIVVTLNFRLGVLGFLKAGIEQQSGSNFGLVDQVAALEWVKDNIAKFGGDPNSVTLFGHGTGAVCASLHMISPMTGNKMLFKRAILMGGSALSDWAIVGRPREVTYQVAKALNCQIHDDFAGCLRRKRLDEIMAATPDTPTYETGFGPVVDHVVVLDDPKKSMTRFNHIFRRFDLMYGVTELESIHLIGPAEFKFGMLEKERNEELRKYLYSRCEMKPDLCVTRTLAEYTDSTKYGGFTGYEPDRASLARDSLLDILSDARTAAPIIQMGKHHAVLNPKSYFYVFTHRNKHKYYLRNKSYIGEELPYVFGTSLSGPRFHFVDKYTETERLFSEIIMTYFSNFAYTGNPNIPRRNEYLTSSSADWFQMDVDWPEFDVEQQRYLQLEIPPKVRNHYREKKMLYWNEEFPELSTNQTWIARATGPPRLVLAKPTLAAPIKNKGIEAFIGRYENFEKPLFTTKTTIYGNVKYRGPEPYHKNDDTKGIVVNSPSDISSATTTNILIIVGSLFLLANLFLFVVLYYKCYRIKKNRNEVLKNEEQVETIEELHEKVQKIDEEAFLDGGCNLMRILSKSSKTDNSFKTIKTNNKFKLKREMSNSTIDAHTKVRDWITQEIVHKYSPRFLRRNRHPVTKSNGKQNINKINEIELLQKSQSIESTSSTLDKSPTRPVSPSDNFNDSRPPLLKSSSIPMQKQGKKPEKVSVAVDATPSGRGSSVLKQQPIELTKSLDRPNFITDAPLRRSITLEDCTIDKIENKPEFRRSSTSINLKLPQVEEKPTVIRIEHAHSRSEPVQDLYSSSNTKKLKTFDPNTDVNVTSRDEDSEPTPLTPEEALMTIKRRNFPKVLPDYPKREALANKRRSMPVSHHNFHPIPESSLMSPPNRFFCGRIPPAPPPRTTSTLGRKPNSETQPVCQSAPVLAEEPPPSPEPEITYNNLYVGPLIPKVHKTETDNSKLNQPNYEGNRKKSVAKTVVTTDPLQPIKKVDPKIIIKPTMSRSISDPKHKNIPRVVASDNLPNTTNNNTHQNGNEEKPISKLNDDNEEKPKSVVKPKLLKPSQIPTLIKNSSGSLNKESSSSESTPSEESDTGTVVKKI